MTFPVRLEVPSASARAETVPLGDIPCSWDNAWDDLAAHAAEPNPFNERWFLGAAVRHLPPNKGSRMVAVWQDGHLAGMMPLAIANRYGRLPVRHVQNWLHYHCFYGAPLIRRGAEAVFWATLLGSLDAADWAPGFLHIAGLDPDGAAFKTLAQTRRADIVHRSERAMLASDLNAQAYYETHVRKKKRKEIGRLRSRLGELGAIRAERMPAGGDIRQWIADFLALEASGWKGREGSALAAQPETRAFFEQCIAAADQAGKLELLRLTRDEEPIAMLVNFMTPPGSYSFKIAFDEAYARFSPGVLIQIENLGVLARDDIAWMDSCAVEDHPMINSLWAERREIIRVTVPLAGLGRRTRFHGARAIETAAAMARGKP